MANSGVIAPPFFNKRPTCGLTLRGLTLRGLTLRGLLTMMVLCNSATKADAGIIFSFSEFGGNVRMEYQGTLNLSGMAYGTVSAIEEHRIRHVQGFAPFAAIVHVYQSPTDVNGNSVRTLRAYSSPFSSTPGIFVSGITPEATTFGGNAIILPTTSISPSATLRLAQADFNGDVWTGAGFMQWDNTTLANLQIDASPKTWVLTNGETITMGITAIPEPSSLVLWCVGITALAVTRRQHCVRLARKSIQMVFNRA
ncbi:MAG: hypothetical protein SFV81_10660 [Pirellulaceae bacterium]|nr:hypothetical protein [Pirellulaceae bacterium]